MADLERLTVALPASQANAVRSAVATGEYSSPSEVLSDALRVWEQRRVRETELLRQHWDDGKASGLAGARDAATVIAEEKVRKAGRP